MRILLTGANGFVGGHLAAGLRARGHDVVAAVRDPAKLRRRVPGIEAIACDFNRDTDARAWLPRLAGVDAVVNCAGVLHGGRGQDIDAIHARTPVALFDACATAGVRKVVQISAISADADAGTPYASTKKRADDHLRGLDLDWTVLRPSLVYGDGSYGGMSAMRGLAGAPLAIPVPGDGVAAFRPIHVEDLVETVARVLDGKAFARRTLEPIGPRRLTLRDILGRLRGWLGLPPARFLLVPLPVMRVVARLVDLFGGGPMGSASLKQLLVGNAGHEPGGVFAAAIGFAPRSFDQALAAHPAGTQDLWHARLYLLRPALRASLALLWILSGVLGWLAPPDSWRDLAGTLAKIDLPAAPLAAAFCVVDVVLGLLILCRVRPGLLALAQIGVVAGYTLVLSVLLPGLWLHPFGPLLKNLPILAAIAVWWALEQER